MDSVKTLVFLPGAWYKSSCWNGVRAEIGRRSKYAWSTTMDYPNYNGEERKEAITLQTYVGHVAEKISKLPGKPIVVGHSMSGIVLSQLAEQHPDKIEAIVYVSAFLLRDGESIWEFIGKRKNGKVGAVKTLEEIEAGQGLKFPVLRIDRATVRERFCNGCEYVSHYNFYDFTPFTPIRTKLKIGKGFESVPKYYIKCTQDKAISLEEQEAMVSNFSLSGIREMETGHSPFLTHAGHLADYLLEIANIPVPLETID
ncbi:MAG: alpha/beta fold hydrolase [Lewinellaceae bacterium]|nr:alpha/beta fold hydrolase [Nitrospira sp.]MCB9266990.1 alpha/beta fold hydrolase [Lewinellaceae bacterium]